MNIPGLVDECVKMSLRVTLMTKKGDKAEGECTEIEAGELDRHDSDLGEVALHGSSERAKERQQKSRTGKKRLWVKVVGQREDEHGMPASQSS